MCSWTIVLDWVLLNRLDYQEMVNNIMEDLAREGMRRYGIRNLNDLPGYRRQFDNPAELFANSATKCQVLLALDNSDPIGLAVCQTAISSWDVSEVLNIHDIYVSKPRRTHGIGTRMILEIERMAAKHNMSQVTLETNLGNLGARRLYWKLGYEGSGLNDEGQCPILSTLGSQQNSLVIRLYKRLKQID